MPLGDGVSQTEDKTTTWMHAAYASFAAGLLLSALVAIPGVYLAYQRRDTDDPVISSHAEWLVRTFWWIIGLTLVFLLTDGSILGTIVLIFGYGFYIYRVVKGWHSFSQDEPIEDTFLRGGDKSDDASGEDA